MEIPGLFILAGAGVLVATIWNNHKKTSQLGAAQQSLETIRKLAEESRHSLEAERRRANQAEANGQQLLQNNSELTKLVKERSKAMPWLVAMAADLQWVHDEREATKLEFKKHPAKSAAETVREHAQEKKRLRIKNRQSRYRIALMEYLVPWLKDVDFEDAESVADRDSLEADDAGDAAAGWLSPDEWEKIAGRDFGRDLIAIDWNGKTLLIECKRWSKYKVIPKAVIFQLFGSAVSYYVERTGSAPPDLNVLFNNIEPWLYATTAVTERIREIALIMGVKIKDDVVVEDWPMVKCNVAADGERIYHLPMDQQYDRVMIAKKDERYVSTVAEAEKWGFRRAKR